jgi:hypothetical protein
MISASNGLPLESTAMVDGRRRQFRSSAGVIAEAPYSGVLPLANFNKVNFSSSTVTGVTLSRCIPPPDARDEQWRTFLRGRA